MKKVSLEKYFAGVSRDSLVYGIGNAVLRILTLLTAPIFTRVFLPSDYGIISLIASVISFVSLFLIFGMDNAIFVSFYQYKKERKEVISSAFWFLFSWGLLLMIVATFFSGSVSNLIFQTTSYRLLFLVTFVTAFLNLIISFTKIVYRLEFRAKTFAIMSVINALITTGLMILLVVYYRQGLLGYFLGSLVGTGITAIISVYTVKHNLKLAISWKRLKEMLIFGSMIVPTSLSFFIFDLSDRFFLSHYRDLTELGLYSIGINISGLLVFFAYAFGQAWSPQVMKIYFESKKIFEQFVPRFFIYYLIFFFGLAVIVTVFSHEVLWIFATEKYFAASSVIGPLALAMVFSASNQVTSLGINIARKTKYFAFYTILAAVLNIGLNLILIPRLGMIGAAYATAISYLFLTVAYFKSGQKYIYLRIDWQKAFKLVGLSVAVILFSPLLFRYGQVTNLIVKFGILLGFIFLLYFFDIIEKQEIGYLKKYFKKFLKIAR